MERQATPVSRMRKGQAHGVQERPVEPLYGPMRVTYRSGHMPLPPAVGLIAHHRVPYGAQVDADLVRPPGSDGNLDESHPRERLRPGDPRHGFPCAACPRGDAFPVEGVATDRQVNTPSLAHNSPYECLVGLLDFPRRKLPGQFGVRRVVFRHHHQARGSPVQAVDDSGPELPADTTQIGHVVEQRVHEGALGMSGARVHYHAGRFVDHDEIRVVMYDVKWQGLWLRGRWRRGRNLDPDPIARVNVTARSGPGAGNLDMPSADESLYLRARPDGSRPCATGDQLGGHEPIKTDAGFAGRHLKFHDYRRFPYRIAERGHGSYVACAAARRGDPPPGVRPSRISMAMLMGISNSDTNCDVETRSRTVPRGSPRKNSMANRASG